MEPHALDGFENGRARVEEAGHGGVGGNPHLRIEMWGTRICGGICGRGGDAYGHFEDGAGAGAEEGGASDFADEGGHVSGVVEGEGLGMEAVFVAEGEVVEEVLDGEDAAFGEACGDAVADALDEFDGRGELKRHGLMVAAEGVRA